MSTPGTDAHARHDPGPDGVARLVERARSGSRSAYAEIVHHFHARLFNFLLRRTGSAEDAEDLTQEALVRAWQRLDQYDARWQFSTWLFTIAGRLAITQRRHRIRTQTLPEDVVERDRSDPGGALADREQGRDLWRLADEHLGETARTALWLHYAEDLPPRDIARILDRSHVAVRVMLHRARAVLANRAAGAAAIGTRMGPPGRGAQPVALNRSVTGGFS